MCRVCSCFFLLGVDPPPPPTTNTVSTLNEKLHEDFHLTNDVDGLQKHDSTLGLMNDNQQLLQNRTPTDEKLLVKTDYPESTNFEIYSPLSIQSFEQSQSESLNSTITNAQQEDEIYEEVKIFISYF